MAAKNVETLVQAMLDREAIRDLPVRYCQGSLSPRGRETG